MRKMLFGVLLAVATVLGVGTIDNGLVPQGQAARPTFYASYTHYKRNLRTGRITRVSSGKSGPYSTRREAQSKVDQYNSQESTSGGYRYFYSARVTGG